MRILLYFVLILLLLISCSKKEKDFNYFEYSYGSTFSSAFSIKFTNNDTVYLREHWNSHIRNDGTKYPEAQTTYFAILTADQRRKLSDLINKIDLKEVKPQYFDDYEDGSAYQIIVEKQALRKTIFVHSLSAPKELDSLSIWINKIKENIQLTKITTELEFKSIDGILTPSLPMPKIN